MSPRKSHNFQVLIPPNFPPTETLRSSCDGLEMSQLEKLDFRDAVVRMATFKKVMKVDRPLVS